jgi:hypothetical protein
MTARQSRVSSAFDPIEESMRVWLCYTYLEAHLGNDDTVTDMYVAHAQSQAGKNTATRRSVLHL